MERRRDPRYPASWPVLLWPNQDFFLFGRATDISLHGMRILLSKLTLAILGVDEICRVDVNPWPWPHAELQRAAMIRHLSEDSIGVETREEVPIERLFGRSIVDTGMTPTSADSE